MRPSALSSKSFNGIYVGAHRDTYRPELLHRAFELAEEGRETCRPNPMVGALIVKDGRVVGEGRHRTAGGHHAEIQAIIEAKGATKGADMYVSLEPCCHHGRTPPCTEAVIDAEIARVIFGALDPNPRVHGQGMERLRDAGLEVEHVGVLPDFARQNEVYVKHITDGRPFLLLKVAISLNGKIARARGEQTRLTGEITRERVHSLRSEFQAILVGAGTVLTDDPLLTARSSGGDLHQPLRVVVDSGGRMPLDSRLVQTSDDNPVLMAATDRLTEPRRAEYEEAGVEVLICAADSGGRVDLNDLLRILGDRGITGVMVEGGATVNETIFRDGLLDKLVLFVAPTMMGGPGTVPILLEESQFSKEFQITECRMVGDDMMVVAYPA